MQSKIGKIRLILADQKRSAQSMARQVMCAQVQPHQEQEMKRDLLGKLLRLQGILKGAIEDGDQLPRFYDPCLGGPQLDLDGTDQSFMVSLISHIQALQAMQPPSVTPSMDVRDLDAVITTVSKPRPNYLLWGIGALVAYQLLKGKPKAAPPKDEEEWAGAPYL
jgi:hypothetical protein